MSTPHPFNTAPDGWREITEAEFARSNYFHESISKTEHRQFPIEWKGKTTYHGVMLLHFWDQTGLALVNEFWDSKVRFFAFGCDHKMTSDGRTDRCTVCDFNHPRRDSSG
jgi:hypothetical protein